MGRFGRILSDLGVAGQMIYCTQACDSKAVVEDSEHILVSLVLSTGLTLFILEWETRVANA